MQDPAAPLLKRPTPPKTVISLVPMIDVMLILLVFFMVTSTYLNLDMIPAVEQNDDANSATSDSDTPSPPLLIRLGADGVPTVQGRPLTDAALEQALAQKVEDDPMARILVLPSGAADMQALVAVMDTATRMGAINVSIIRLEASP